jgi:hypothetical protein
MTQPPIPVPPSLAEVLSVCGFRASVKVERLDGKAMSAADEQLARGIVEFHEKPISDAQIQSAVAAHLADKADASAPKPTASSRKAGITGGQTSKGLVNRYKDTRDAAVVYNYGKGDTAARKVTPRITAKKGTKGSKESKTSTTPTRRG